MAAMNEEDAAGASANPIIDGGVPPHPLRDVERKPDGWNICYGRFPHTHAEMESDFSLQ